MLDGIKDTNMNIRPILTVWLDNHNAQLIRIVKLTNCPIESEIRFYNIKGKIVLIQFLNDQCFQFFLPAKFTYCMDDELEAVEKYLQGVSHERNKKKTHLG